MKKILFVSFAILVFLSALALANLPFLKSFVLGRNDIIRPQAIRDPLKDLELALREKNIDLRYDPIASESAIVAFLAKSDTVVLFSFVKDPIIQVGSLQIILDKLTMEAKSAKKIDLRFHDPIVVY